jgi:hypothetical protein
MPFVPETIYRTTRNHTKAQKVVPMLLVKVCIASSYSTLYCFGCYVNYKECHSGSVCFGIKVMGLVGGKKRGKVLGVLSRPVSCVIVHLGWLIGCLFVCSACSSTCTNVAVHWHIAIRWAFVTATLNHKICCSTPSLMSSNCVILAGTHHLVSFHSCVALISRARCVNNMPC